ncbi:MAG: TRAP transporter small permease [Zoogloeaceae bacterium]|nr:TRAP transporter small permease [Zoogloeaceae bacterium]
MRAHLDRLFNLAGYLAGFFTVCTLLAVLASIIGRLIPAVNLAGADAYAGYSMAAAAFLALAPTLRRGEHIRVTLILNRLGTGAHRVLDIVCHLIGLAMAVALAWYSIRLVMQSHEFMDISTGLDATPLWIPQLGMAIGTSLFALAFASDLFALLAGQPLREESQAGEPSHIE